MPFSISRLLSSRKTDIIPAILESDIKSCRFCIILISFCISNEYVRQREGHSPTYWCLHFLCSIFAFCFLFDKSSNQNDSIIIWSITHHYKLCKLQDQQPQMSCIHKVKWNGRTNRKAISSHYIVYEAYKLRLMQVLFKVSVLLLLNNTNIIEFENRVGHQ